MTAGLAISGITKNLVFSTRRTDRAVNADNLAVSFGNADIASGQIKNALESAEILAKESKSGLVTGFKGASEAIKALSKESTIFEGAGKVIGFTADHINPIIGVVGGVKVLTAKDKEEAFTEEAPAIATMLAFESVAKNALELEKKVKDPVTGKKILTKRVAFYKSNPFLKTQSEKMESAINDYCATKKLFNKISLKSAPAVTKGLLFVGASIAGYEVGKSIGKKINANRRVAKQTEITQNHNETNTYSKAA